MNILNVVIEDIRSWYKTTDPEAWVGILIGILGLILLPFILMGGGTMYGN